MGAFDYSSQEPRLVVHYAGLMKLSGAEKFVGEYKKDKFTDFHQLAADIVGVPRKQAKILTWVCSMEWVRINWQSSWV